MPVEKDKSTKAEDCKPTGWKAILAMAAVKVPNTLSEFLWKGSLIGLGLTATLSGMLLWRNPGIIFGEPIEKQSLIKRLSAHEDDKKKVFDLMEKHYYRHRPLGLMLISWEKLDSLVGVWVRPADDFPRKSGEHGLDVEMRTLGGHFLFGECAQTESLSIPGKTMIACPIVSAYDVWGYVGMVVEEDSAADSIPLLQLLAHRITTLVY